MDERIRELAQDAIDLHTDPRSRMMFRLDINKAVTQVVHEQDTLDLDTLGDIVQYRDTLISEVSSSVEELTQPRHINENIVIPTENHNGHNNLSG